MCLGKFELKVLKVWENKFSLLINFGQANGLERDGRPSKTHKFVRNASTTARSFCLEIKFLIESLRYPVIWIKSSRFTAAPRSPLTLRPKQHSSCTQFVRNFSNSPTCKSALVSLLSRCSQLAYYDCWHRRCHFVVDENCLQMNLKAISQNLPDSLATNQCTRSRC